MEKLLVEKGALFELAKGLDSTFGTLKDFYIEGEKVERIILKEGSCNLGIKLGNGEVLGKAHILKNHKTTEEMTQYMEEILKQAEQKYGAKVLGTENKELDGVNQGKVNGETNKISL